MTQAGIVGNSFDQALPRRRSGMLVGGSGEPVELRAAVAWSAIPLIVSGAMYFVALGLARESGGYGSIATSLCLAAQSMLRLGEVFFILGLWRFAICFACTGETQAIPMRQTAVTRTLTAIIVVSALFALAIVMLAPAVTSLGVTATALAV